MSYYNQQNQSQYQPQPQYQAPQQGGDIMGWDDAITVDAKEFTLLAPGEYEFEVVNFTREEYTPGENSKIPACPMAVITIRVMDTDSLEEVEIPNNRLYLYKKHEWKLAQFFTCIGQKKEGEDLRPNWNAVIGAKGICEIEHNEWNGSKRNRVKNWLPPQAPAQQAPPQQQSYRGF